MEKEKDDGNIEYKLSICDKTPRRMEELITQMSYRLNEGHGECMYIIGISDNGNCIGIYEKEYQDTLDNLAHMAHVNSCSMEILSKKEVEPERYVSEIYFRENIKTKYIDIKVAIAGNVDAGKSSLIGVLVNGKNDNGRGSARVSVFNHNHEIASGRTSSIAHHILGFDASGNAINYEQKRGDWTEIVNKSSKVISFFDLAGHEKYLRTTILGLSSSYPDLCLIMVGANMGVTRMTREHIFLCVVLGIPFAIVISKIDIARDRQNILQETVDNIKKILKIPGIRKVPYKIKTKDDTLLCLKNMAGQSLVPMFFISNVTGEGISELKHFLNLTNKNKTYDFSNNKDVEYHIDSVFQVNGVGVVVGGHIKSGKISVNDKLYMGPRNGRYEQFIVRSIHVKKMNVETVENNSYACLALKKAHKSHIRRGMVMVSNPADQIQVWRFKAHISVLRTHSTTIKPGYEPVVHVNAMRQVATILDIQDKVSIKNTENDKILRTGDKAIVSFKFKFRSEFIRPGFKILLAEGKVKIIGTITELL